MTERRCVHSIKERVQAGTTRQGHPIYTTLPARSCPEGIPCAECPNRRPPHA